MVEVLLQNGAKVNAAKKVICHVWKHMLQRNARQGARNEMQSAGMALAMADHIVSMVVGQGC